MKFSIYQHQISREAINRINDIGWSGDFGEYDMEVRIIRDVGSMGSKKYIPEMSKYYSLVANCEARDLSHVFEIGNIRKNELELVADRMASVSVGDIIHCHGNNCFFMVNVFGFSLIDFFEVV